MPTHGKGEDRPAEEDFDADLHPEEPIEEPGIVAGQRDAEGIKALRNSLGQQPDAAEFARLTVVVDG